MRKTVQKYTGGKLEHAKWTLFKLFTQLLKHSVGMTSVDEEAALDGIKTFFVTHLFWPLRPDVATTEIEKRKKFIDYILERSEEILLV